MVAAIGWVPIAIAVVIAAIVLLYNKCEWFRDVVNAIWTQVKDFFRLIWTDRTLHITGGVLSTVHFLISDSH